MKHLVIIDANYICHMAKHTTLGLSYDGLETGILFGFLKSLIKIGEQLNPDLVAFAWDSHKSVRRWMYEEYKANRHDDDEDIFIQQKIFKQFQMAKDEMVPKLGFKNNYIQDGYEGDDIIAQLCYPRVPYKTTIVSADHDLLQLLNQHCSMYKIVTGELITEESFKEKYQIEPYKWSLVKSIAGCPTDNVAGVKGVGEKTAIKYLKGELKETHKTYQRIEESEEIIDRNFDLVDLPMKGSKPIQVVDGVVKLKDFIEVCDRFGFKSLLNHKIYNIWSEAFCEVEEDDIPW